jgi:N-acetyl-gamma-glutamyl-phosphate reductase
VAVVGANGYSGLELCRLLLNHPQAELRVCFGRDESWKLSQDLMVEGAENVPTRNLHELLRTASEFDCIFLATPPEVSMELIPQLITKTKVIDLSGAFRLSLEDFQSYYKEKHSCPDLLLSANYGLVPFAKSESRQLISNPGCFATATLLGLIPLLGDRLIDANQIVIDAKSGTTGGGRKAKENLLFSEVDGNCLPYRVGEHQHLPEIIRYVREFSGVQIEPHFVTHLLPVRRGIIAGLYLQRAEDFQHATDTEYSDFLNRSYTSIYGPKNPLIKFGSVQQNSQLLVLRNVVGTARTQISFAVKGRKVFVFSCIDNLLKGAASQALENWNLNHKWPTELGLTQIEVSL